MEAVKQKLAVSQQVDEVEVAMDRILQEQVVDRLSGSQDSMQGMQDTLTRKLSRNIMAMFGKQ